MKKLSSYAALTALVTSLLVAPLGQSERLQLGTRENPVFEQDFKWERYQSPDERFSAEFPITPHTTTSTAPNGGVSHYTTVYAINEDGASGNLLRISYSDSPPEELAGYTAADVYDAVGQQLTGELTTAESETLQFGNLEARKLTMSGDPQQQILMILVENRLYLLFGGVDAVSERFINSFQAR